MARTDNFESNMQETDTIMYEERMDGGDIAASGNMIGVTMVTQSLSNGNLLKKRCAKHQFS